MADTNNHNTSEPEVQDKQEGDVITAESFREMIDVLDSLIEHNHTFTDTYNTNCQCSSGGGGTM